MKDMKRDYSSMATSVESQEYSGLKLYLSDNQVKCLGLDGEMPEAGSSLMIKAMGVVKRTMEECTEAGESYSMCIEIMQMECKGMKSKNVAESLYGKGEDEDE